MIPNTYQNSNFFVFFGGIHTSMENLKGQFPDFQFQSIKQTHSDIVLAASDSLAEADAHFTAETKKALIIKTADCMPIMVYCPQTNRIAAVHAGWRGVENKITEKTLQQLIRTGSTKKKFQVFIGPSILQNSFEVDLDVFIKLKAVQYNLVDADFYYAANNKYYIDLNKIVLSQIENLTDGNATVTFTNIDTKTNLDFFSYRRGKQKPERNLSFICLLT